MSNRIVVADDEAHIVLAVSMKLHKAGFVVETARDGQEAWDIVRRDPPDLLITDCQMPRMNGLQLCQAIRSVPELDGLPIFMLTAKGLELDEQELSRELKINRLLVKPFSPREILKEVEAALAAPAAS